MEQGELIRQWTWEPMIAESLILLLFDPNDVIIYNLKNYHLIFDWVMDFSVPVSIPHVYTPENPLCLNVVRSDSQYQTYFFGPE